MQANSLVVDANPFTYNPITIEWEPGKTLAEIAVEYVEPRNLEMTTIAIDGMIVKRDYWHVVRPKIGTLITIKTLPAGGDALRMVALVALAVAAPYAGAWVGSAGFASTAAGASALSTAVTAGVYAVGAIAINAMIPVEVSDFDNGETRSNSLSITGARNRLEPFGVMPMVLGTVRQFPPYAARPYTSMSGDIQTVHMLFCVGYKDMFVDAGSVKLGNTAIQAYDGYDFQLDTGYTSDPIESYQDTVYEEALNLKIVRYSWVQHTTPPDVDRVIYEIHFPYGLARFDSRNNKENQTVEVMVEYRNEDSGGAWTPVPESPINFTARTINPIRQGFTFVFPTRGRYSIRMQTYGDTKDDNDSKVMRERYFGVLRSIIDEPPVSYEDAALVAVELTATDQLSGTPDTVNMVCTTLCPTWNGADWTEVGPSSNCAALARFVLTGIGNNRPLDPVRIDDAAFGAWAEYCDTMGFTFNMVVDSNRTVHQVLGLIGTAGRARVMQVDSLWTVKIDHYQSVRHQVFTPRNTWGWNVTNTYADKLHAWRIRYINEAEDYQNDEVVWFNDKGDGTYYDETTAINYESLEFQGVTNYTQVNRMARYYAAVAELQKEIFSFNVDAEHLLCLPGDRVEYSHDALLVGQVAARIKAISATEVQLDTIVSMAPGVAYGIKLRTDENGIGTYEVEGVLSATDTDTLIWSDNHTGKLGAVGDLCVFGEFGVITQPLLVRDIMPNPDLSAKLVCIPYQPDLYTGGPIPDYKSYITYPVGAKKPVFGLIRSDESVLLRDNSGMLQTRMQVTLEYPNTRINVTGVVVRYREWAESGEVSAPWVGLGVMPGDTGLFYITGNLQDGEEYEIKARFEFGDGSSGEWTDYVDPDTGNPYYIVVGQTTPPPDLDWLTASVDADGTRFYDWDFSDEQKLDLPPDIEGTVIRMLDTDSFDPTEEVSFELISGENYTLLGGSYSIPPDELWSYTPPTWTEIANQTNAFRFSSASEGAETYVTDTGVSPPLNDGITYSANFTIVNASGDVGVTLYLGDGATQQVTGNGTYSLPVTANNFTTFNGLYIGQKAVSTQTDFDIYFASISGGDLPTEDYVLIKKTGVPTWDQMIPLHQGVVTDHPMESNNPFQGSWYFAAKAIDYGGRVSENPVYTTPQITTLPLPRIGNTIAYMDHASQAPPWLVDPTVHPGSLLTDCTIDPATLYLQPVGTGTWANVSPNRWDGGSGNWQGSHAATMSIEHETNVPSGTIPDGIGMFHFDAPVTVRWVQEVIELGGAVPLYEVNYKSSDAGGWSGWQTTSADDNSRTGTDFSFRLTINGPDSTGISNWLIYGYT